MPYLKAKMHQIRFRLGISLDPAGGAHSAPPDPLAGFKGPTSNGRKDGKEVQGSLGEGKVGERREGKGGEERERERRRKLVAPWLLGDERPLLHYC